MKRRKNGGCILILIRLTFYMLAFISLIAIIAGAYATIGVALISIFLCIAGYNAIKAIIIKVNKHIQNKQAIVVSDISNESTASLEPTNQTIDMNTRQETPELSNYKDQPKSTSKKFLSDSELHIFALECNALLSHEEEMAQYRNEAEIDNTNKNYHFINLQDADIYFAEAGKIVIQNDKASIGNIQRLLKIGFNRTARIMDQLRDAGVIGPEEGTIPCKVLMSMEEFELYLAECSKLDELRTHEPKEEPQNTCSAETNYNNMTGEEFECFCSSLLKKCGFENVVQTQGSGDRGVDIVAMKDDIIYAIQCKCYSSSVGNKAVQEVYSGKDIYAADIAVVLASNYFTAQAIEDAEKLHVRLWDKDKLEAFIKASSES